ncbi:DnaD domain protein [Geobacillus zalihae]|uniref:DnaD domain-containing protein n=1 Tax=Geobacillus zalihae TaxID=213419 RepID=UPI002636FECA|nr:DnaD domain protein [Geobacillus zalihae]WKA46925.1 DnaD domain protein [Geobacillus zalihae]
MSNLLFDDQPLVILPQLALAIGLNESIVVQQLHYWLKKSENVHDGYKWVYNTYADWQRQFPFWSESTVRRTITKLEKMGIIVAANFNRSKIDKTKWYRIDYDKLAEITKEMSEMSGGEHGQAADDGVMTAHNGVSIVQGAVSFTQDGASFVHDEGLTTHGGDSIVQDGVSAVQGGASVVHGEVLASGTSTAQNKVLAMEERGSMRPSSVSMIQQHPISAVCDGVSTGQNEQTMGETVRPFAQNEPSNWSNWAVEVLNLTRPIPETTTEMTSEIKREDEEDARVRTYKEIVRFCEENGFGVIGDYLREKINAWVDDASDELVLEALKIAVENGAKRWVYVDTILRDWTEKGYRTVDEVRAARLAFREQRMKQRSAPPSSDGGRTMRKPIRTEIVPDWLKMDYSQPEDDDFDVEQARRELEERLKKYKTNLDG